MLNAQRGIDFGSCVKKMGKDNYRKKEEAELNILYLFFTDYLTQFGGLIFSIKFFKRLCGNYL